MLSVYDKCLMKRYKSLYPLVVGSNPNSLKVIYLKNPVERKLYRILKKILLTLLHQSVRKKVLLYALLMGIQTEADQKRRTGIYIV